MKRKRQSECNKLVLIGNGFDLAHGLKTSYKNFLDWYMCEALQQFCDNKIYKDFLIEITNTYTSMFSLSKQKPKTFEEVLNFIKSSTYQSIKYQSNFFERLLDSFKENNWVDIERDYFRLLKTYFSNTGFSQNEKKELVCNLNKEFDFLITKLSEYIKIKTSLLRYI
jgi:hypothetical protein